MDLRHGFRAFFFQRPPDRFVRERIDEFEFDDFLGQQSQRPAIAALWRCRAGQLREVRFNPAIDFRRDRRRAPQLSDQGRLGSIQNRSLAPVLNGPFGDVQGVGDVPVAPRRPQFPLVALQQRLGASDLPLCNGLFTSPPFGDLRQVLAFLLGKLQHVLGSHVILLGRRKTCHLADHFIHESKDVTQH